jgi:hypothetical protein
MKKLLGAVLLAPSSASPALAQDGPKAPPDKADQAIARAIDFLVRCRTRTARSATSTTTRRR